MSARGTEAPGAETNHGTISFIYFDYSLLTPVPAGSSRLADAGALKRRFGRTSPLRAGLAAGPPAVIPTDRTGRSMVRLHIVH